MIILLKNGKYFFRNFWEADVVPTSDRAGMRAMRESRFFLIVSSYLSLLGAQALSQDFFRGGGQGANFDF